MCLRRFSKRGGCASGGVQRASLPQLCALEGIVAGVGALERVLSYKKAYFDGLS